MNDTAVATINIFAPSNAGNDVNMEVCKNTPLNLNNTLSQDALSGGNWLDDNYNPIGDPTAINETIPGNYKYFYINENGACVADTSTIEILVDGTCDWLNVADEALQDVAIFPNPTTDEINIVGLKGNDNIFIVLLNLQGKILLEQTVPHGESSIKLPIQNLRNGIYSLKITSTDSQKVFKVVKE